MMDGLRDALARFDGKAVSLLGEAEARFGSRPGYRDALVTLAFDRDAAVSGGATWLLKAALEQGAAVDTPRLVAGLGKESGWAASLHLCQSVRFLDVEDAEPVVTWLRPLLSHKRPFLRAWALDAMVHVAKAAPDHAQEAEAALEQAGRDAAASVRARARNLSLS